MNYIILGVGFIGKNLAIALNKIISKNDHIILVDKNYNNLEFLKDKVNATFYNYDIRDLTGIFDGIVFNLCANVGVKSWNDNPYYNYKDNQEITEYIIDRCLKENCEKYIFASTSEIYGSSECITEDSEFKLLNFYKNPRGLYAFEKLQGELLSQKIPNHINARFFNIIGKYQDIEKGVVPLFINQMNNNISVTATDDTRCFCDVRDCVNALIAIARSDFKGNINICNPNNHLSMIELAQKIKDKLKSNSIINTLKNGDIHNRIGQSLILDKYYSVKYNIDDTLEWMIH